MQNHPAPVRDLVLVGAGHSHVQVLRRFGMRPIGGVRITLVARELWTPYSGMLPGHVAGSYSEEEMHIDVGPLARFAGARVLHTEVHGIDLDQRLLLCHSRPPVRFDVVSLNIGAVPEGGPLGLPVKPIGRFLPEWRARAAALPATAHIALVGTGAGGVELALALRTAHPQMQITLIGHRWLPGMNAKAAALLVQACEARGIEVIDGVRAEEDGEHGLLLSDGRHLACDEVFWVTGVRAPGWLKDSGLATDDQGFVRVDAALRSLSHPNVYAAGDIACLQNQEWPKSGVYAVRAGPALTHNLRAAVAGGRPKLFRPQQHFLTLIGTGDGAAVGAKWQWAQRSKAMWWWKDWIDRRFMQRFKRLPDAQKMVGRPVTTSAEIRAAQPDDMRCGGCGAKLGADLLQSVLKQLPITKRAHVRVGIGDDAAEIVTESSSLLTTDGLRNMVDDPYLFGRIVAHHNLNDLFAMNAVPTAALALATVPLMAEAMMADELRALLLGAVEVLEAHDVPLVGGHSAEGAELFLGLTLCGRPGPQTLTKGGLQAGDVLITNKAIGSGVLLAAAMQGIADSRQVARVVESMDQSNAAALTAMVRCGATALTDVTGFGLLGHLGEMLRASGVGAAVDVDGVPVFDGALQCLAQGVSSSLQSNNEKVLTDFAGVNNRGAQRLLCDPQTSGGLLAGIPAEHAEECVGLLKAQGYVHAAAIGVVHDDAPVLR